MCSRQTYAFRRERDDDIIKKGQYWAEDREYCFSSYLFLSVIPTYGCISNECPQEFHMSPETYNMKFKQVIHCTWKSGKEEACDKIKWSVIGCPSAQKYLVLPEGGDSLGVVLGNCAGVLIYKKNIILH